MRIGWISLFLLALVSTAQASFGPNPGPYCRMGAPVADAVGRSNALLPILLAAGACSLAVLPIDGYFFVRHPLDEMGAHFGDEACTTTGVSVGQGFYYVTGFPFWVGERILAPRSQP